MVIVRSSLKTSLLQAMSDTVSSRVREVSNMHQEIAILEIFN